MRRSRFLAPLAAGALLATGGAAFLAVNAQPASGQGVSSESIDGYNISNIHYNVTPAKIGDNLYVKSMTFTATTTTNGELAAQQAYAKIDPPSSSTDSVTNGLPSLTNYDQWVSCVRTGGDSTTGVSNFSCDFTVMFGLGGVPVNGPSFFGHSNTGWLDNLSLEVNQ